jgi:beta-phosphoglucomutase-like phosphatase (HAD superfamily)
VDLLVLQQLGLPLTHQDLEVFVGMTNPEMWKRIKQLRHFFSAIVSGEEVERGKPAPDVFLKAAELLQIPAKHCTVLEDSTNGIDAAKAAGMKCIGFLNPNSGSQNLSNADLIVHSITQISLSALEY